MPPAKLTISVIVPTLDDESLPRTVEALLRQDRPADEIIVVGRDQAGRMEAFPQVRFIDTGRPVCAAAARNLAMAEASGDILVFTDSDGVPLPDWLTRHEQAQLAGHWVVGGGVRVEGPNYWAQADNFTMFHDHMINHAPAERMLLATLNMSVRREVIAAVGGMDESFPRAGGEDSDWVIRMRRAGWPAWFEPAAQVAHVPNRISLAGVIRHCRGLGSASMRVRLRYPDLWQTPGWAASAFWLTLLSPVIAVLITARIYAHPWAWRSLHYLPVVYASKIWYCQGASAALRSGFAHDPQQRIPQPVATASASA